MTENAKQEVLRLIERMPDDASLDEIMYEIYFRERVERGLQEVKAGQTVTHEDVKRSLGGEWLQSAGR